MLLELAAAWRPRWYYVFKNKTSGMRYIGQTMQVDMSRYCGSGEYWISHCNKHGGHIRSNIEVLEQVWFECEQKAAGWLTQFEKNNNAYYLKENTNWANRAKETTQDSAFCGLTKEQRVEFCKSGGVAAYKKRPDLYVENGKKQGAANAKSGHMQRIQKIGCSLGGKASGLKNLQKAWTTENARIGGVAAAKIKHSQKDPETGKSVAAVKMGLASARTKKLLSNFCNIFGIKNPGKNYINVDKKAFECWRLNNDS